MPRPPRLPRAARAFLAGSVALVALLPADAARAASLVRLPGHIPIAESSSKNLGPVASTARVSALLTLPLRNPASLDSLLTKIYNPKDPLYGKYLSSDGFDAQFSPAQADYNAVVAFATAKGLTVTPYSSRTLLGVSGPAAGIEALLSVHLHNFQASDGKTTYFAPIDEPGVPASLAGKITGVLGLSNYATLKPLFRVAPPGARRFGVPGRENAVGADFGGGTGHDRAFAPKDLRTAYSVADLPADGSGQIVAEYEEGGFFPQDISTYKTYYKLPDVPVKVRSVDGFSGAVDDPNVSVEAALDIDMQIALAPGAKEILVYESPLNYPQGLIDALVLAGKDNLAKQFSISYGLAEQIVGLPAIKAENSALRKLAAEGVTVYASAGDQGAYTDGIVPAVSDPASQPVITAVGGTALYTETGGAYIGEETWNELGIYGAAGGGGVSTVWTIPAYQVSAGPAANGGSKTMRNVPDISAVAAILTGVDIYSTAAGGWIDVGGTSVSAPIWAGYTARINQVRHEAAIPPLGFANPALYAIGASFNGFFDFHDVLDLSNGNPALFGFPGYNAGFGYDDATGYGSMVGDQLLDDLASAPAKNVAPPKAPTYFNAVGGPYEVTLTWKPAPGAKGYYLFRVPSPNAGSFLAATTATRYVDHAVTPGVLYQYSLEAVNAGGGTFAPYTVYAEPTK